MPSTNAIPADVMASLDAGRGYPDEWIRSTYTAETLRWLWSLWLAASPVGREVAAELAQQAAAEITAHQLQLEAERQQREAEAAARAEQEQWRLEPGTEVTVRHPRTHADGMTGRVLRMEWRGNALWAEVEVDPCPTEHPEAQIPVRLRRHYRPFTVTVPARDLHTEANRL